MKHSGGDHVMGTDIHGFIEFRLENVPGYWFAAINIGSLAERYYYLFSYLFGVRDSDGPYFPVAARRSMPPHVAEETELLFKTYGGDKPTWLEWRAFREALATGHSVHTYRQEAVDQLLPVEKPWKISPSDYFTASEQEWLRQGKEVEKDGYLYRYENDGPFPVGPGWQLIVELGDRLAQVYSEERVRLVIWFTS
jgi:hypothetical protein